jgi:hypothetical protein
MSRIHLLSMLTSLLFCQVSFSQVPQVQPTVADSLTLRLSPSKFPQLPRAIITFLQQGGYTIPQGWDNPIPHNVISGSFATKGQRDWAVLASRNHISTIFVFWNGSAKNPAAIAPQKDITGPPVVYLEEKIGFIRQINGADKQFIMEHYQWYGGPKPPPIDHEGIDDGVVESGSRVYYFYEGKWLTLTGAD